MTPRQAPERVSRWATVPGLTHTAHLFHREDDGREVSRCGKLTLGASAFLRLSTVISAHAPFCPRCWGVSRPGKPFPGQPVGAARPEDAA